MPNYFICYSQKQIQEFEEAVEKEYIERGKELIQHVPYYRNPRDEIVVKEEPVNKQSHYTRFKIQPLEFCKVNNLGYLEGNVIKYVCRYPYKGTPLRDLEKAKDYIEHLISKVKEKG